MKDARRRRIGDSLGLFTILRAGTSSGGRYRNFDRRKQIGPATERSFAMVQLRRSCVGSGDLVSTNVHNPNQLRWGGMALRTESSYACSTRWATVSTSKPSR